MTPRGGIQAEIEDRFKQQVKAEKTDGLPDIRCEGWTRICCTLAKPALSENQKFRDIESGLGPGKQGRFRVREGRFLSRFRGLLSWVS